MDEKLRRKSNRLENYDYSNDGAYFITICTKDHEKLFDNISVGAESCRPQLSEIGVLVEPEIMRLSHTYENVSVDSYVIMPNHVHMIITICGGKRHQNAAPTSVSQIVSQWKRAVSIKVGFSPWQKSFHDHVIRNQEDYNRIAEYIENNPARWVDDCYYE